MIVPMKKVSLIVLAREAEAALVKLRDLGVVHVEHHEVPKGTDIQSLNDDLAFVREALSILSEKEFLEAQCDEKHNVPADWRTAARKITTDRKRLDQLQEYSHNLKNSIVQWQLWGDFNPADIQALAGKNIFVRLYIIPEKEISDLPTEAIVKVMARHAETAYCVVISRKSLDIPYKEVALPRMGLSSMNARYEQDRQAIQDVLKDIRKWACYKQSFLNIEKAFEKELEFHEALRGMGSAGELAYLSGYAPVDAQDIFTAAAAREKWGILITDPSPEDPMPTLVRNPRWVSLIQPLLKLLEVLPGYKELDISPLFLIFFSLFFGMLIGDAGYGIVYFIGTFLVHRKFGARLQDKRIFSLMYLLSSCAIVWGVLTGTFFGQAWLAGIGVKALAPALNDPVFIQGLCFFIGVTHLSLAHSWRFIVRLPSLTALAELGWIAILWAAFFLVKMLLLGAAFPAFGRYLIIAGISLVVLFSSPRKNIFATIGAGLGSLALSIMNSFGDIVSYVRLFAVGLAGVAISDAFNSMAGGAAASSAFGFLAAGLILVAGHLLNFVLSPMSVLVHGVRLNVLEFSGHAGVTWSGIPYKPLKKGE